MRLQFIAKDGYPVERFAGHWFMNLLRLLFHTRAIRRIT